MARIPLPSPDEMTPEQRRVHDTIVAGPRGTVIGPLRAVIHNPALAERWSALGEILRFGTSLPKRLNELAILVTAPALKGDEAGFPFAFFAVVSIAVIGLYIAYVLPTYLRLQQGDAFVPGPWHLGRWSRVVGWIAVAWVCLISIVFMLPTVYPITWANLNYTPVAVVAVLGFAGIWWILSAHRWYVGPKVQGTPDELAAIERELARPGEA